MTDSKIYYNPEFPNTEDVYGWESETDFKVRRMTQNRPNKHGQVKIEIEVERYQYQGTGKYARKRFYVNTNIWVNKGNWNNKTQKLSKKEENSVTKTNKINSIFSAVQSYISSKGQQEITDAYGEEVDFTKVREIFPRRKENRKTFHKYLEDYRKHRASDNDTAPTTLKIIKTVTNRVKSFDKYRGTNTHIEDINLTWSDDFNRWMVQVKNYAPSTIERCYEIIIVCLKYYWKRKDELQIAMNEKFMDNEFKHGKKEGNRPNALTINQREIIYNHRFTKPYLEKARKMMCIQMYTACRYSDIKKFTPDNFIANDKLKFIPQKTKRYNIEVIQPLHPNVLEIFKEVNFNTSAEYGTSSQKYNTYVTDVMKELMEHYPDAEFSDDYTTHNFRDTAISIWCKAGINFKSILRWSGLKKYETLNHYLDLDDEFEKQEMKKTVFTT
ncbi:MAG: tyrosine-type recombinase/integrase [Prolixibacteraceae bacterium]|nr:tyrosine-type recombinase/integrase [Prolixibacteraceae bacterium]